MGPLCGYLRQICCWSKILCIHPALQGAWEPTAVRSLHGGCSASVCVNSGPTHDCICVHCVSRKNLMLIFAFLFLLLQISLYIYPVKSSQQTGSGIIGVASGFERNHKSETSIISLWSFSKQRWRIYSTWDSKGETAGGYCRRYWFS